MKSRHIWVSVQELAKEVGTGSWVVEDEDVALWKSTFLLHVVSQLLGTETKK